ALYPRPARDQFNLLRLLFPKGRDYYSPAIRSAIDAKDLLKSGKLPTFKQIKDIVTNLDDLLYFQWQKGYVERSHKVYHFDMGGWSLRQDQEKAFSCFEVLHFTEQAPDPANRIMLSNDRDVFGYPKMQLQWRWSDQDIQSIRRAQALFKQEFAKAGLGELKVELDQGLPRMIYPSIHHHMGTTRMHESPKHGVVDANCRVHGVSNLYVASSSVFPTSGYANPTLTIVAIAIRVADQIKRKMAQPSLEISQTVV
ncbi:MAG TPA: GMC family oxidoreductase, partial [Trichocoleus sp.]